MDKTAPKPNIKTTRRRKPRQSRSWQTSLAIQEALAQLLTTENYEHITIRQIVDLAGVGLGTFYEYFSSKEELTRVCLHFHTKRIVSLMEEHIKTVSGTTNNDQIVQQLVAINIDFHRNTPEKWGAFYMLERHYSGRPAYQKMYDRFVLAWYEALLKTNYANHLNEQQLHDMAITLQTLVYGLIGHAFMSNDHVLDFASLETRLSQAINAYLEGCLGSA